MKTYQLRSEILAPNSLQETFAMFENPGNLTKITPPWLGFQILTKNLVMRKGLEIDYRFRWLGLPMTWRTLITAYEPPFLFEDVALKSPYAFWKHRIRSALMSEGRSLEMWWIMRCPWDFWAGSRTSWWFTSRFGRSLSTGRRH